MLLRTPHKIIYLFGESSIWSTFTITRPGRGEVGCSQVSDTCPPHPFTLSLLMLHLLTQQWGEVSQEEPEPLRA